MTMFAAKFGWKFWKKNDPYSWSSTWICWLNMTFLLAENNHFVLILDLYKDLVFSFKDMSLFSLVRSWDMSLKSRTSAFGFLLFFNFVCLLLCFLFDISFSWSSKMCLLISSFLAIKSSSEESRAVVDVS